MIKIFQVLSKTAVLFLFCISHLWAAGSSVDIPKMLPEVDLQDLPSLQRGAKYYMDYCLSCHSMTYQRYEQTVDFLKIPHDVFLERFVFDPDTKIGDKIQNSMTPEVAKALFGAPPPDLTLVARLRGADWLYAYLRAFYVDESRVFGVNNEIFPSVGMPHVLAKFQGLQEKGCKSVPLLTEDGWERRDPLTSEVIYTEVCDVLVPQVDASGKLSAEEYDQMIYDIVNFLYYVGEPSRLERYRLGVYVLTFLLILFGFTYLLNREYWKDVK